MNPGLEFERNCCEYLTRTYAGNGLTFECTGGMNSTVSDIAVRKNGKVCFFIEAKDSAAQSGQFVLLPNELLRRFEFSPRNHSEPNEMTNVIINYMNNDFERFNNAGTAGEHININPTVFNNWITEHYREKFVKYFISYNGGYVIIPLNKFSDYFDISATFRIKKSGSTEPSNKDIPAVKNEIGKYYDVNFIQNGKKLFAEINGRVVQDHFPLGNYTYFLSSQNNRLYEVRRLSNTYNMNVIFSISINRKQDKSDLNEFISDL